MHHWGRTALLALSASLVVAAPASAAPGEPFDVNCEGTTYTLTSGNGKWAVAKDTESNTHFIPVAFTFTARDSAGNVFSDSEEKKGHRNQEKITCTFGGTFTEGGETFTFEGSAEVVQKP
jgi:hypothetical protein